MTIKTLISALPNVVDGACGIKRCEQSREIELNSSPSCSLDSLYLLLLLVLLISIIINYLKVEIKLVHFLEIILLLKGTINFCFVAYICIIL